MNYIDGNKEAWEEAFENRDAAWGIDVVEKIKTESFPFFVKDMVSVLRKYQLADKSIGQFCSNNGRELLSLMQSGAKDGIGFDIAENQVRFANEAAKDLSVNCRFVATNILEIGSEYHDRFDLIIITIGALCWFKDLNAFFEKAAQCLKKDGLIIINESHPVTNMLGAEGEDNFNKECPANILNSYFEKEWIENDGIGYITKKTYESKTFMSFTHSFGDIIGAMCKNSIHVIGLQEFDYCISGMFEKLNHTGIPLSYIIEARKV